MEERNDAWYIEKVLSGETETFSFLVEKYKDKVFGMAFHLLQQREEAEDAAQDVFVKAYKGLKAFRKKSQFSTWLYRIVYNECISRLRKVKYRSIQLEEDLLTLPQNETLNGEEAWLNQEVREKRLRTALLHLAAIDRSLVVFYYYENQSIDQIAELVSLSASNVKIRLFRARKKLFSMLVKTGMNEFAKN